MITPAPKVSVVLPTYQRQALLEITLATILSQTLRDIEVIVADDGSTDGTAAYVRSLDDPRIRLIQRQRRGWPAILIDGFAEARGQYIMTCHDHDIYAPTLLEELSAALDRHPTAAYALSGSLLVDQSTTRELDRYVHPWPEFFNGRDFLRLHLLPGLDSAVSALTMVRRSSLSAPVFDASYGWVSDVELWLRLAATHDVAYVAKPLIRIRARDENSALSPDSYKLVPQVLRAKRLYLDRIDDLSARREIEISWQRHVDQSVLLELLRAHRNSRRDVIPALVKFSEAEGTTVGARSFRLLLALPRPIALLLLQFIRLVVRAYRRSIKFARSSRRFLFALRGRPWTTVATG